MLCWEGYDAADIITGFKRRHNLDLSAQCLLSDAAVSDALLAGQHEDCDILNINNAYLRDCLDLEGLVKPLDNSLNERYRDNIHPLYRPFLPWSYRNNGELIGIGQRFGPFNMVINTDVISQTSAEDEGFSLADNARFEGRFGILDYPDFNLFHICIGAGLNPFDALSEDQFAAFNQTAARWLQSAKLLDADHRRLNKALIAGDIDFYISGGIYTASPARLQGHSQVLAITPRRGPIAGKGGIAFSEITALLQHPQAHPEAERFLDYMLEPEAAIAIAFVDGTCNPVAQMGDPRVFKAFSQQQLHAIQWDGPKGGGLEGAGLEAQLKRCADYQIPPNRKALMTSLTQLKSLYQSSFGG